ncbi:MAG TPA: BTAD domain-containing putative transcriptional regulator [Streptosporangiaceae bacterium]|nr:BTAD domain-containing putative transcriptional regulator [Streptosporangiaceae bacterium]
MLVSRKIVDGGPLEFKILGPIEVTAGAERIDVGGTRQQIVIATLQLAANHVVPVDRLLEAIYGEDLPPTSRSQVQISISSLRRMLGRHNSTAIITTHSYGYVFETGGEQLDSVRFEDLAAAGRAARDRTDPKEAAARYRDALRLWRGPALDGIDSQLLRAAASLLDGQRVNLNEECIQLELDLGKHHELVGELTSLIEEYPLREGLRGQLMLALYRCDRTAEALEAYRQARQTMIDEVGVEPSDRLRRLERAILLSDPSLAPPPGSLTIQVATRRRPNMLPTDIADFVGREEQIVEVRAALGRKPSAAVPVVVIVGRGGVGKTSLAVHVSHQFMGDFADGQLFADLHGASSHPIGPMHALERFLRAMGVPGSQIPDGLDERAEVYRGLLGDRKTLVVIDDAASESQVRPLLPGGAAAAVIVTSRNRLAGLAGAIHVDVNVFNAEWSLKLLARIVGAARVRSQASEASLVAQHCGHLPLALRIAGARLSARPNWSIQRLVDRLADETRRLDELRYGDLDVRPSILLTYQSANVDARRLFRLLALLDLTHFPRWVSSVLLDQPLTHADDLLDDLVNAQLIELTGTGSGVHQQYRFHDLIRVFARERLAAEEPAAKRSAALERWFGALLYLAEQAHSRYLGGDYACLPSDAPRWQLPEGLMEQLLSDPISWYESTRLALVSAVRQAAQAGFTELCWGLAYNSATLFEVRRSYLDDWRASHDIALEVTRRVGDIRGQAAMLYSIGSLHVAQHRFELAREEFAAATRLFAQAGDEQGIAIVTCQTAYIDRLTGHLADAEARYEQALALFKKIPDLTAAVYVLHGLAQIKLELRQIAEAKSLLAQASRLNQALRPGRVEAQVLHRTGEAHLLSGEVREAIDSFERALDRVRGIGDHIGESYALQGIGVAQIRQRRYEEALGTLLRALELAQASSERLAEGRALLGLCELALARDGLDLAIAYGQQAVDVFRLMSSPLYEAQAYTLLSYAHTARGNSDISSALEEQAAALRIKLVADAQLP